MDNVKYYALEAHILWMERVYMLIQEAIEKAIEGGYTRYQRNDPSWPLPEQYFLDTSFWEALGRTLGWEGESEDIHVLGDESQKVRQPMWLSYWHQFTHHLVTGKTPESFFATL
jgi:hypothetical protein